MDSTACARWTSYSQFGEDAVIQAYLRGRAHETHGDQTKFRRDGFYVDVGAFHPTSLSNTLWLYEQGWNGINVDATPGVKEMFDLERIRDTNLHLAISDKDGPVTFYSYGHSVLNTLESTKVNWSQNPAMVQVEALTLASLLDTYLPQGKQVDILSVDVEGHDLLVLRSNNWEKYRPELVLAELHEKSIEAITESELYRFMVGNGYTLHAWTQPTLIFRRTGS